MTVAGLVSAATAQDAEAEKSTFVRFVEDKLSSDNRRIGLNGIEGALSSNVSIAEITIADRDGIWLRIVNAQLVWTRSALLLGRLDIDSLAADRIEVIRKPLPDESPPDLEASGGFQLPELPVSVIIEELSVPSVSFGPTVFGLESEVSINGSITLADGALESELAIERIDGPGGTFNLVANYANESRELELDLTVSEPEDGMIANLLQIEGRPAVELTLAGTGPVADLQLDLTLATNGNNALTGVTTLKDVDGGQAVNVSVRGLVGRLVAPAYRPFFDGTTSIDAAALLKQGGGLDIDKIAVKSGNLELDASAETAADGFLRRLAVNANISATDGGKVVLPVPGGDTSVGATQLDISFGQDRTDRWSGSLAIDNFQASEFRAESARVTFGGQATNLDKPQERRVTFEVGGAIEAVETDDPAVRKALGERIDITASGRWAAGEPVEIASARISANALAAELAGQIAEAAFDGDIRFSASSLAPLSGIADRPLAGSVDLAARGNVAPVTGAFDLTFDGSARSLELGSELADRLLESAVTLSGRLARTTEGLEADRFTIRNDELTFVADGKYARSDSNFALGFSLSDLSLISEQLAGRLTAQGTARSSGGPVALVFDIDVPSGKLADRPLSEASLSFNGELTGTGGENGSTYGDGVSGRISGTGYLDGERLALQGDIVANDETRKIDDLELRAGGATIAGSLAQGSSGLINGKLTVRAPNVSSLAALALTEATGSVNADVELMDVGGQQNADVSADITSLVVGDAKISSGSLNAVIDDLFGVPQAEGSARVEGVSAGGVDVRQASVTAKRSENRTDFNAGAALVNGTDIALTGTLEDLEKGLRVALSQADLRQGRTSAQLAEPASLVVSDGTITVDSLVLDVDGGRVSARGSAGDTIDATVEITRLPLSIANTVVPDLGTGGTVSGTARITGSRDKPNVDFDVTARSVTAKALKDAGLPAVDLDANGTTDGSRLTVDADLSAAGGIAASANGTVPLDGGRMALDIELKQFPLAAVDRMAGGQGLRGSLSGSARVGGTLSDPDVDFKVNGTGLSATPLANAGVGPLTLAANGQFSGQTVTLRSARTESAAGLSIEASGRIPLSGPGLSIKAQGRAPLSIANRSLAERGTRIDGTAEISLNVSGSISNSSISGMVSTSNARVADPESNLRLNSINLLAGIEANRVSINRLSASMGGGGSLSGSGTISLDAGAGFPADLSLSLNSARYSDGEFLTATASGQLTVTGALARDPVIDGVINVENAEIGIPDVSGGGANLTNVKHVDPPSDVERTLDRAKINSGGTPVPTSRPSVVRLNIKLNAPRRIFVRGRGLDAELGGSLTVTGPISNVSPVGGFELIRGRLSILGRRVVFDEGTVTLTGDLDPFVNLVARSQTGDTTVFITVSGRASNPSIEFSSQPALPQDEVLARLIFDRSVGELSGFQIAQLAAAVAELSGGQNTSLLGSLRQSTGLDDLDVTTDAEGNAALRAGRYIQDNVYLGVQAGADGTSEVTIDLDITENLKARGSAGSGGKSSVGIFFERDY